jgi:hypothetical protein
MFFAIHAREKPYLKKNQAFSMRRESSKKMTILMILMIFDDFDQSRFFNFQ